MRIFPSQRHKKRSSPWPKSTVKRSCGLQPTRSLRSILQAIRLSLGLQNTRGILPWESWDALRNQSKVKIVANQETEEKETVAAESTPEIPHQEPEIPQVRLSRKQVLLQFGDWLQQTNTSHIVLDKSGHAVFAKVERTAPDFIVYNETANQLVFVRPALSEEQREDLRLWKKSFGTGFEAVRVWQVETADGSNWEWRPIDAESSAEAAELSSGE